LHETGCAPEHPRCAGLPLSSSAPLATLAAAPLSGVLMVLLPTPQDAKAAISQDLQEHQLYTARLSRCIGCGAAAAVRGRATGLGAAGRAIAKKSGAVRDGTACAGVPRGIVKGAQLLRVMAPVSPTAEPGTRRRLEAAWSTHCASAAAGASPLPPNPARGNPWSVCSCCCFSVCGSPASVVRWLTPWLGCSDLSSGASSRCDRCCSS
jgi:hypothetical protein